jgi:hypothetical protein
MCSPVEKLSYSGLAVAADYEAGQKMIRDRSFEENAEYFATVFEIGRRHKILNPECMRTGDDTSSFHNFCQVATMSDLLGFFSSIFLPSS